MQRRACAALFRRNLTVEQGDLLGHFVDMGGIEFAVGLQGAQQLALRVSAIRDSVTG